MYHSSDSTPTPLPPPCHPTATSTPPPPPPTPPPPPPTHTHTHKIKNVQSRKSWHDVWKSSKDMLISIMQINICEALYFAITLFNQFSAYRDGLVNYFRHDCLNHMTLVACVYKTLIVAMIIFVLLQLGIALKYFPSILGIALKYFPSIKFYKRPISWKLLVLLLPVFSL